MQQSGKPACGLLFQTRALIKKTMLFFKDRNRRVYYMYICIYICVYNKKHRTKLDFEDRKQTIETRHVYVYIYIYISRCTYILNVFHMNFIPIRFMYIYVYMIHMCLYIYKHMYIYIYIYILVCIIKHMFEICIYVGFY